MSQPGAGRIPATPLLEYFRTTLCRRPRGRDWAAFRLSEAAKWNGNPAGLADLFQASVEKVGREYRNYQPFYPKSHTFGTRGNSMTPHGAELRATVDVAARLARQQTWSVEGDRRLDFRYLDREVPVARAKPKPEQDPESLLEVDLFLANARDRTPILAEIKIWTDECAFFALIQLLTQAAYAVTNSQRERLVLFGSQPDFVLLEALPGKPARTDLYVFLVRQPFKSPYDELRLAAIELSKKLAADKRMATCIRRIAWINGTETSDGGLQLEAI